MIALSFVEQLNQANTFTRPFEEVESGRAILTLEQDTPLQASSFALQFLESLNRRNVFSSHSQSPSLSALEYPDTLFDNGSSPATTSQISDSNSIISSAAQVAGCATLSHLVFLSQSDAVDLQVSNPKSDSSVADLLVKNSRLVAGAVCSSSLILLDCLSE